MYEIKRVSNFVITFFSLSYVFAWTPNVLAADSCATMGNRIANHLDEAVDQPLPKSTEQTKAAQDFARDRPDFPTNKEFQENLLTGTKMTDRTTGEVINFPGFPKNGKPKFTSDGQRKVFVDKDGGTWSPCYPVERCDGGLHFDYVPAGSSKHYNAMIDPAQGQEIAQALGLGVPAGGQAAARSSGQIPFSDLSQKKKVEQFRKSVRKSLSKDEAKKLRNQGLPSNDLTLKERRAWADLLLGRKVTDAEWEGIASAHARPGTYDELSWSQLRKKIEDLKKAGDDGTGVLSRQERERLVRGGAAGSGGQAVSPINEVAEVAEATLASSQKGSSSLARATQVIESDVISDLAQEGIDITRLRTTAALADIGRADALKPESLARSIGSVFDDGSMQATKVLNDLMDPARAKAGGKIIGEKRAKEIFDSLGSDYGKGWKTLTPEEQGFARSVLGDPRIQHHMLAEHSNPSALAQTGREEVAHYNPSLKKKLGPDGTKYVTKAGSDQEDMVSALVAQLDRSAMRTRGWGSLRSDSGEIFDRMRDYQKFAGRGVENQQRAIQHAFSDVINESENTLRRTIEEADALGVELPKKVLKNIKDNILKLKKVEEAVSYPSLGGRTVSTSQQNVAQITIKGSDGKSQTFQFSTSAQLRNYLSRWHNL